MPSFRNAKTSDFFEANLRTFDVKHRNFCPKKSDVLHFRSLPPQKKFFVFLLHFLHQSLKFPLYIGNFGCRIGCRIRGGCRMNPTFCALFTLFSPLFGPQYPAFPYDSVPNTAQNCSTIERFLDGSSAKHSKWVQLYWRLLLWTNKVEYGRIFLPTSCTISCKAGCEVSQNGAVGVG